MSELEPYLIDIGADVLDDLRWRLARARLPDASPRPGWQDGMDSDQLADLVRYWQQRFDWRSHERELNLLAHYRALIDGLGVHFVWRRGAAPGRMPVLLLHGWPSTFLQMLPLSELLSAPGGAGLDVVIPSLPGFGFSDRPTDPGWNVARIAEALHRLMTQTLGYERYAAHGTDFGLAVALYLGSAHPSQVAGVHVGASHLRVDEPPDDLTEHERQFVAASQAWYAEEAAYNDLQATKPQTAGTALNDSPAGLMAWIAEKHHTWSIPDALGRIITLDYLAATATIYWATETMTSSARLYREERLSPTMMRPVGCPLAIIQPALEEYQTPESWWRRSQPVTRYTPIPGAAHFPELEAPHAIAASIQNLLNG